MTNFGEARVDDLVSESADLKALLADDAAVSGGLLGTSPY